MQDSIRRTVMGQESFWQATLHARLRCCDARSRSSRRRFGFGIEPRVQIIINEIAQVEVTQIRDTDSLNFSIHVPLHKPIAWRVRSYPMGVTSLGSTGILLAPHDPSNSSARRPQSEINKEF